MDSYYTVLKMCCFRFNLPYAVEFREEEDRGDDTESSHESSACVKPDVEELEMLLEAYFVQFDGTLNKLCHVCYISFYSLLLLLVIGLIGNP